MNPERKRRGEKAAIALFFVIPVIAAVLRSGGDSAAILGRALIHIPAFAFFYGWACRQIADIEIGEEYICLREGVFLPGQARFRCRDVIRFSTESREVLTWNMHKGYRR